MLARENVYVLISKDDHIWKFKNSLETVHKYRRKDFFAFRGYNLLLIPIYHLFASFVIIKAI